LRGQYATDIRAAELKMLSYVKTTVPFWESIMKLTRRELLARTGIAYLATMAGGCVSNLNHTKKQRPNFVFIMTDDQSYDAFGFEQRYSFLKTPNFDKLAAEGAVFKNAFVTTSLCSPSRASILTGAYGHKHGVTMNEISDPDPRLATLPQILQDHGYETALIGKWHMEHSAKPRAGFDYWLSFEGQGRYIDPELNENGRVFVEKGYLTDILTQKAIDWINKPHDKPYCLFVWHKAVHEITVAAKRHKGMYADAVLEKPASFDDDYSDKPQWYRRGIKYGVHKEPWRKSEGKPVPKAVPLQKWNPKNEIMIRYFECLQSVDDSVGAIVETLKKQDQLDNTMVIFTSDNGYILGEHQSGDKRKMWEESIKVPILIRYPKLIKRNTEIDQMVLNIDFAPTILELAGAKPAKTMQGESFVPLLRSEKVNWRKSILYNYMEETGYAPGIATMIGIRTDNFKLIHYPDYPNDIDELYDLENDPIEMKNLFNDKAYQDKLLELITELKVLLKKYDCPIPFVEKKRTGNDL
jgi:N-acetylglucosamine-6-sulfatase